MKSVDCEEIYRDGRHYDLQNQMLTEDREFFCQELAWASSVLEIACGTGRISIDLAHKGIQVTGIDISEGMLNHACKKRDDAGLKIDFIQADCRDFNLEKKFDVILFPFNSIAHLHTYEDLQGFFVSAKKHMHEKSMLVIDIFNPDFRYFMREPTRRTPVFKYSDPDGNGIVTVTESNVYERKTQVNRITWYFKIGEKPEIAEPLNMRIFFPEELDLILKHFGMKIVHKYGDYNKQEFSEDSKKQIVFCVKDNTF